MTKLSQNTSATEQENKYQTEEPKGLEGFDLESLRVSQDFVKDSGVKKLLTTVPVRKPNRQDFVRVHPDSSYVLDTMLLNLKEERETYLVAPSFWDEIPQELTFTRLALAANRQKVIFLWQLRLPDSSGKTDAWSLSALEAYEEAKMRWVRVAANMSLGAYEIFEALGELSDPEWPEESMDEIVRIAFRNSFIESYDHPVLRRLRGES
jgi:hypothetical protein